MFEIKSKITDFERGKAIILTTGIHVVFRGLKFEPDADIGQISADFERGRFEIGSHIALNIGKALWRMV